MISLYRKIVGAPYVNNEIPKLKRVYWNHNYNYVALVCKKSKKIFIQRHS